MAYGKINRTFSFLLSAISYRPLALLLEIEK